MDESSRANAASSVVHESTAADEPEWLIRYEGDELEVLSKEETTGQLDPRRLCRWLLKQCLERGVQLHQPARVTSVSKDARDELAGVRILSLKDGVETDSEWRLVTHNLAYWTELTGQQSPMHEASIHSRAMDSKGLFISFPIGKGVDTHLSTRRLLTRPEVAALDRRECQSRGSKTSCNLHNRPIRIQPRVLLS